MTDFDRVFSGCRITITDTGSAPLLPPPKTKQGAGAMHELIDIFKTLGEGIETLPEGRRRIRRHRLLEDDVELVIDCERIASRDEARPVQLHWGGGRLFLANERRDFVWDVVVKKLNTNYEKPRTEFWLLIYSTDVLLNQGGTQEQFAITGLLNLVHHPYDKVWYFFPYGNLELGHLVLLWPH